MDKPRKIAIGFTTRQRLLAFLAVCFIGGDSWAGNLGGQDAAAQSWEHVPSEKPLVGPFCDLRPLVGPYCGVYSLYACLLANGLTVDPADLVDSDFIGSPNGSSVADLERGAKRFGATATAFSHLTARELRRCPSPLILNVRSNMNPSRQFDHWIAFLGIRNDQALVYDPATDETAPQHIPIASLLAIWNGAAVAVSVGPLDLGFIVASRVEVSSLLLLVMVAFATSGRFATRTISCRASQRLLARGLAEAAFLGLASLALACLHHVAFPSGFFLNRQAVGNVCERYLTAPLAEIDRTEMRREMANERSLVIVDARYPSDYVRGTLPGAINIPINSSIAERRRLMQNVLGDQPVVVFCQSARCGYSDDVATYLHYNGFRNVRIYRGGYVDWIAPLPRLQQNSGDTPLVGVTNAVDADR